MSAGGAAAGQKPPMGSPMGGAPLNTAPPGGTFFGGKVGPNMQGSSTGMSPMGMPQYGGVNQPQANKLQYGPAFDDTPINQQYSSPDGQSPRQLRNGGEDDTPINRQYDKTGQATMKGMSPFNMQGPDIQRLLQQYQSGQGGQGGKGGMPAKRGFGGQEPRMMGGMLGGGMRGGSTYDTPAPYEGGKTNQMVYDNYARQQAEFLARGQPQQPARGGLEALLGNMAGKKSSTNSLQ